MILRTWDIETTEWNKFKVGSVYDGNKGYICNSLQEIVETMKRLGGTFYAHYGGGFDNLFLLEHLKQYKVRWKNINSKLVHISVYYNNSKKKLFELKDSYPILPLSLEVLAQNFLGRGKKKIDRKKIHTYSKEVLEEYVLDDSILLYEVITIFLKKTEKEKLELTIASDSKKEFKKTYNYKLLEVPAVFDSYFREAFSGGRVEVFQRYGKNLYHRDVKSMYASMMDKHEYPAGYCVLTSEYKEGSLGIYRCEIESPKKLDIPFLHTYAKDGKIIFPLGNWSGTYTSAEIEKAISIGYKIKIIDGYYFTLKERPFKNYIKKWYDIKQESENKGDKALRLIAKLYLNSLFGKLGQRRKFQKIISKTAPMSYYMKKYGSIKDYLPEINAVVVDEESTSKFTTVHVACFITAYSRITLYEGMELIQSKGGTVYYCDTDCIITNLDLPTGKKLGDWDLENESPIKEGIFIFPKFYGYVMEDGTNTIRHKGLSGKNEKGFEKYTMDDYKRALFKHDFSVFSEEWDGIASILECKQRHIKHLSVIQKSRKVTNQFTKRLILDNYNTVPLIIGE